MIDIARSSGRSLANGGSAFGFALSASETVTRPSYGGGCEACARRHQIEATDEALEAAAELFASLESHQDFGVLTPDRSASTPSIPTLASFQPEGGQMLGVLISTDPQGKRRSLFAFSGKLQGRAHVSGWVPPIAFREGKPDWLREGEAQLKAASLELDREARAIEDEAARLTSAILEREAAFTTEHVALKQRHARNRAARRARRALLVKLPSPDRAAERRKLDDESSEASLRERAFRARHRLEREGLEAGLVRLASRGTAIATARAERSRALQTRVFDEYLLASPGQGERRLRDVFLGDGLPPTGTGDCCAPKLLQAATILGLRPVGLVEFWWGASPSAGGRQHGRVYPACHAKCAPILGFMLCQEGLE